MGLFTGALVEGFGPPGNAPVQRQGHPARLYLSQDMIRPNRAVPFDDTKWMEVPFELQVLDDSENNPDYLMDYVLSKETS
jgi:hypothetical protein